MNHTMHCLKWNRAGYGSQLKTLDLKYHEKSHLFFANRYSRYINTLGRAIDEESTASFYCRIRGMDSFLICINQKII